MYTTFFRQLNTALGRWMTCDEKFQPHQSPYNSMDGNPIGLTDNSGLGTENADGTITVVDKDDAWSIFWRQFGTGKQQDYQDFLALNGIDPESGTINGNPLHTGQVLQVPIAMKVASQARRHTKALLDIKPPSFTMNPEDAKWFANDNSVQNGYQMVMDEFYGTHNANYGQTMYSTERGDNTETGKELALKEINRYVREVKAVENYFRPFVPTPLASGRLDETFSVVDLIPAGKIINIGRSYFAKIAAKGGVSLLDDAASLVAKNGGKNSVTIETATQKIRYDLAGKAHGGVPTPHMQVYNKNFVNGVQKSVSRAGKEAIPMTQKDLDLVRIYLTGQ